MIELGLSRLGLGLGLGLVGVIMVSVGARINRVQALVLLTKHDLH